MFKPFYISSPTAIFFKDCSRNSFETPTANFSDSYFETVADMLQHSKAAAALLLKLLQQFFLRDFSCDFMQHF